MNVAGVPIEKWSDPAQGEMGKESYVSKLHETCETRSEKRTNGARMSVNPPVYD